MCIRDSFSTYSLILQIRNVPCLISWSYGAVYSITTFLDMQRSVFVVHSKNSWTRKSEQPTPDTNLGKRNVAFLLRMANGLVPGAEGPWFWNTNTQRSALHSVHSCFRRNTKVEIWHLYSFFGQGPWFVAACFHRVPWQSCDSCQSSKLRKGRVKGFFATTTKSQDLGTNDCVPACHPVMVLSYHVLFTVQSYLFISLKK